MKRLIMSAAAVLVAVTASLALAQPKPIKAPPGAKTPAGVKIKSFVAVATCNREEDLKVTVEYTNLKVATKATLWGSIGEQEIDIPAGTGTKDVLFKGPKLDCSKEASLRAAADQVVYLGDTGMYLNEFRASAKTGVPLQ